MAIDSLISRGVELGFFSYVLPFVLIFVIVFAILQKSKLLGEGKKQLDAIVALAIGLLAIQFSYLSEFFSTLFTNFGIGLAIFLVLMLLTGLFYSDSDKDQKKVFMWIGIILAVGILLWTFAGWQSWNFSFGFGNFFQENFWTLVVILIIAAIIFLMSKSGKLDKKNPPASTLLSG